MRLSTSFLLLFALTASAQAPQTAAPLNFDVASVHLTKAGAASGGIKPLPGGHGYTAVGIPVRVMISLMYRIPFRQISGGPDWINDERYDVEARVDGSSYSVEDLHTMYQNFLADRFHLKFHIVTKEANVYALTVDPSGLKMKPNTTPEDYEIPIQGAPPKTIGKRVYMPYLAWFLGQNLQADGRPVVDQTGLKGYFDFTLSYMPQLPPGFNPDTLPPEYHDLPSIFVAVKDQLGLKLTPTKGPVQEMIIDHIDKPTEN